MTKFGQAEYGDFMARCLPISLMKFLKLPKNRISTAETQKIFTKNLYRQKMQLKEVLRC